MASMWPLHGLTVCVCACVSQWSGAAIPAALFGPDCPQILEVKLEPEEQNPTIFSTSVCEFISYHSYHRIVSQIQLLLNNKNALIQETSLCVCDAPEEHGIIIRTVDTATQLRPAICHESFFFF